MIKFASIESAHLEGIAAVERACFRPNEQWTGNLLLPLCEQGHGLVALVEDDVVGCLLFRQQEAYGCETPGDMGFRIISLAVMPKYRRLGIARSLMSMVLALHPGDWELNVRATNSPAQTLYLQMGFEPIDILQGYYSSDGEDAICMLRPGSKPSRKSDVDNAPEMEARFNPHPELTL